MSKSICLYLHVHQPFRVKAYSIFDISKNHEYFNDDLQSSDLNNQKLIDKVAQKAYLPTNKILLELLQNIPDFKLSLSMSGVVIEQFEKWAPQVLDSFKELVQTGRVEIVAETYYHSLAFFYSMPEFEEQVTLHRQKVQDNIWSVAKNI